MHNKQKKAIIFTSFGACLEWFEFTLYAYTAHYLTQVIFPKESMVNGLLAIFGIFAAGYLMRPIGGVIIGYLGDKKGRSYALKLSILLMSIPMLITTIMPTYQQIGNYAVLILIFTRMLQGFSVGGEYTGVLIMLIEHSPIKKRGLITSFASISSSLGVLLSSMTVATLASILTSEQMVTWGWRVAFGVGTILAIVSFFMQQSVAESPMYVEFKKEEKNAMPKPAFFSSLIQYRRSLLYVFVLTGYLGIAYYIMAAYLPNSLISLRDINTSTILWITTLFSAVYAFTAPIWGYLTDIVGRKTVILIPTLILMLTAAPLFNIFANGAIFLIVLAQILLAVLISAATCGFQVTINELFPTKNRYSGVSSSYNISNAIFGGSAPVIATLLVSHTGNPSSPAFYLIGASIVTLIVISTMPETLNSKYFQIKAIKDEPIIQI